MDTERYKRLKSIFVEASRLEGAEREQYLSSACDGDEDLRTEIESLLTHHADADDFLKPLSRLPDILEQESGAMPVPERIGHYRILRLIGTGGMSSVYEAEQDAPRRKVAIKLMRSLFASKRIVRRLEFEAQILGRLRHPGIAQVYEAATYEQSGLRLPYFVMEYVEDAMPISDYVSRNQLSRRERVELFIRVCEAVAHGHTRGIIHRDLKPANILVDADGVAKVIDFGVARMTDVEVQTPRTLQTEVGQILGTPQYMSPEQFVGDPQEIDTRSDVYSLGVVLFELLAEAPPYDVRQKTIIEAAEVVRRQPPRRLGSVSRLCRGDLETIVSKALEKDPSQRYATASELAQDLRSHLADRPITARPPSAVYRARAFIRRNKTLVTSVSAVILALAFGLTLTWIQAVRAERAAARAEAINQFMRESLGAVDRLNPKPDEIGVGTTELRVSQLLRNALPRVEKSFGDEPELEAEIRETLGLAFRGLGEFGESIEQFERVWQIRRRLYGEDDPETLRTRLLIGFNYSWLLRDAEAEAIYRETLPKLVKTFGPEHELTLECKLNLADALQWQGKFDEAGPLMESNLEALRRVNGPNHPDTINAMADYCSFLRNKGEFREAVAMIDDVIQRSRVHRGEGDRITLYLLKLKGQTLGELGRYREAQQVLEDALDRYTEAFGQDHTWINWVKADLAWVIAQADQWEAGEQTLRRVYEEQLGELGAEHAYTRDTMRYLGFVLVHTGKLDEAVDLAMRLAAASEAAVGEQHPYTQLARGTAGAARYMRGELAEGEALLRGAVEKISQRLGDDHPITGLGQLHLGACLRRMKRHRESELMLRAAEKTLSNARGERHRLVVQTRGELLALYRETGEQQKAAEVKAAMEAALKP